MATQAQPSKLNKAERKTLANGIDALIAGKTRATAKEENAEIKAIRESEIANLVILKNKLMTLELELQ